MLKAITQDGFYDLMGMSDKSVLGTVDAYHQSVNSQILSMYQEESVGDQNIQYSDENKTSDKEAIISYKKEFEWINENYDFGNEYYNESINEILKLIDEYDEGNQDTLSFLINRFFDQNEEQSYDHLLDEATDILNSKTSLIVAARVLFKNHFEVTSYTEEEGVEVARAFRDVIKREGDKESPE